MKLVPNWRRVLRHAWSLWLIALAGLLSAAEVALPLVQSHLPIPVGVFAMLSALAAGGGFVARLLAQNAFQDDYK